MADINSDNIADLIVGNRNADDGGTDRGAVIISFLNSAGGVLSFQRISASSNSGFTATLDNYDGFVC
jgi:hypothetical protein